MRILATIFDVFGEFEPLTNAYIVQDSKGLAVSIPGHPEFARWLTEAAQDAYPGPAHGTRDAWMARWVAEQLGVDRVELTPVEDPFPDAEREY